MRILLDYLPGSGGESVAAALAKKLKSFAVNTNADVRRFTSLEESDRKSFQLVYGTMASTVADYTPLRATRAYLACHPITRAIRFIESAKKDRLNFYHPLATKLSPSRVVAKSSPMQNAMAKTLNPDLYDIIATDRESLIKTLGFAGTKLEPENLPDVPQDDFLAIGELNLSDWGLWTWIEERAGREGVYLRSRTWHPSEVAIVTTHFNVCGFARLRETYQQWRPSIAHPVQCYEAVYRGQSPEIENSIAIPCGPANDVWQKERLINLAVSRLPVEVRYVAWIDHDLIFGNPNWMAESVEMLRSGYHAVQPFSAINNLGRSGEVESIGYGSMFARGQDSSNPGGAWIANRKWLDLIGGLYDRAIVGGGDAIFYSALTGKRKVFHERHSEAFNRHIDRYYSRIGRANVGYLPGEVNHLWHGDRENRQYRSRDETMMGMGYDPELHVDVDENGLMAWTSDAPREMRLAVVKYFADRREDG